MSVQLIDLKVYTDGSATIASKPGGYGFVLVIDNMAVLEGAGHMEQASNNDAEMQAAIEGLKAAHRHMGYLIQEAHDKDMEDAKTSFMLLSRTVEFNVTLCSDSQLILGWANGTYNFKQKDKIDKYKELRMLMKLTKATTQWVKGHDGNEFNEYCDKLANKARLKKVAQIDRIEASISGDTVIGTKKNGVVALWYKGILKVLDLDNNVIEDYKRDTHGIRGSILEIKEEKLRS